MAKEGQRVRIRKMIQTAIQDPNPSPRCKMKMGILCYMPLKTAITLNLSS
jgi:hypothetical protein